MNSTVGHCGCKYILNNSGLGNAQYPLRCGDAAGTQRTDLYVGVLYCRFLHLSLAVQAFENG